MSRVLHPSTSQHRFHHNCCENMRVCELHVSFSSYWNNQISTWGTQRCQTSRLQCEQSHSTIWFDFTSTSNKDQTSLFVGPAFTSGGPETLQEIPTKQNSTSRIVWWAARAGAGIINWMCFQQRPVTAATSHCSHLTASLNLLEEYHVSSFWWCHSLETHLKSRPFLASRSPEL